MPRRTAPFPRTRSPDSSTAPGATVPGDHAAASIDASHARPVLAELQELRGFLDEASVGLHRVAPDGTILWANPAEMAMLGVRPEEFLGQDIRKFHADPALVEDLLARLVRGERVRNLAARLRAKDGTIRHVLIDSSGWFEDGVFRHTRCSTRDITALRQSQETVALVTENTRDLVSLLDPGGRILYASLSHHAVLGYPPEELLGTSALDLVHPEDLPAAQAALAGIASGRGARVLARTRHRDGRWRWLEAQAAVVEKDGRPLLLASARDVTERHLAQEALRASQAQLQAILDHSTAVVYLKQADGRYLLINRRYEELFHISREAVVGRTDEDIFGPAFAAAFRANDRRVIEAGQPLEFEEVAPHPDGPHTYISVKFPIRDEAGRVVATGGISTDITERKQAEQAVHAINARLREVDALKTRIINTAAHELRTPLMPMALHLDLLRGAALGADGAAAKASLDVLQRNLDRLTRLIEDMLDAARLDHGHLALRRAPLDARALLDEAAGTFQEAARRAGVDLAVDAEGPLPVEGDAVRLGQVLDNLLTNALHATRPGDRIFLEGRRDGGAVVIRVRDTGLGLTPTQLARLFLPFAMVRESEGHDLGGTGVGLSICKGIMELHGGRIRAESGGPGRGTVVTVELPAREP